MKQVGVPVLAFVVVLCAALCGACATAQAADGPYEVTDERGRTVRLAAVPVRIVSMLPSLSEAVCELGQCRRLVGVDRFSNWPADVERLPHLGGLDDVNVEGIVALKPDLVLLSRSARVTDRLETLGLKVMVLEPKTRDDVRRVLDVLGQLFRLPASEPQRLWQAIEAGVQAQAASLPPALRGARVYFEVNSGPYAAGESSFIGQTLTGLGVRNIVSTELGPFPKLSPEFVVRADPDLIMLADRNEQSLAQRPGWAAMRAVREDRVCRFTLAQIDVLVRPGPRLAEAARIMADCVRDKAPSLTTASGAQ